MYLGDFLKGELVPLPWNTTGLDGSSITRATNGTARLYKNGSAVAVITAGITSVEDFNSKTGMHLDTIDTANAAYTAGDEYAFSVDGMVIDGKPVNAFTWTFSIQRRSSLKPVVGVAQGGAAGNVQLPAAASSVDGAYEGAFVVITGGTGAGQTRWRGATYTGSTRTFSVDPAFTTAPDNTSIVEVHLVPPPRTTTPLPVNVTAMATDVLSAAAASAAFVTKVQNGLATAAALATIDDFLDTEIAAILNTVLAIWAVTDEMGADGDTTKLLAQEVAYVMSGGRGNTWEIVGSPGSEELAFTDTNGTTVRSSVPILRLLSALHGIRKMGG